MKRPVSPQSTPDGQRQKKARFSFGIFSALKNVFVPAQKHSPSSNRIPTEDVQIDITNDDISNSFLSRKRSIHSNASSTRGPSSIIPRASISGSSGKLAYDSLFNTLTSEAKAEPTLAPEVDLSRDVSPCVYLPRNPILPVNPEEMELGVAESEPEFDLLYRDEEGNLVRPPFINLDPKERYQMLQMKKSVQASQALQDSLKYMVDPDETTSIIRSGNRVDTATQTHNEDYLEKKLHFNATRKRLALASRSQRKKPRNFFSGDFIYDRSKASEPDSSSSKLSGYLGEVSKPKFPIAPSSVKSPESAGKSPEEPKVKFSARSFKNSNQLDQAYIDRSNKLSSILRVKDQAQESTSKPVGPSSGFSFEVSKDKFTTASSTPAKDASSLFGAPKPTKNAAEPSAPKVAFKPTEIPGSNAKPLFAPPFEDGAQDDRPAKKTRTRDDAGQTDTAAKPAFSFGLSAKAPSTSDSKSSEKPTSLFGAKSSENTGFFGAKSSESTSLFGTKPSEKPTGLFGAKPALNNTPSTSSLAKDSESKASSQPAFSFGASNTTKKNSTPLFSFHKSESTGKDSTPSFSFQKSDSTGKESTPLFSFQKTDSKDKEDKEEPKNNDTSKPAFSFGAKPSPPTFSFGAKPAEKPEEKASEEGSKVLETTVPKLSFSSTPTSADSNAKPSGSLFGAKADDSKENKPTFSFGAAKDSDKNTPKPAFAFGSKPVSSGSAFSFGSKGPGTEKEENETTPVSSSGDTQEPKEKKQATPFAFGKIESPVSADTNSGVEDKKTPFSFGKQTPTNSEAKPVFSFGQASKNDSKSLPQPSASAPVPTFSFDKTTDAPITNNKSFSFGQSATADPASIFGKSGSSAPAPAFNFSVSATPKATTPVPASQGSSTGGFSFSNGVIPGLGSRSATPVAAASNFGANNGFGANNTNNGFGGNNTSNGFGSNNTNNGFGSTNSTNTFGASNNNMALNNGFGANPNNGSSFGFGGTSAPVFPAAQGSVPGFGERARTATPNSNANPFGFNQNQPTPGFGGADGGFAFSNNAMSNNVFNSAPGSFGQPSRDSTPPAFGAMGGFPQAAVPGQSFTPPVANVSGRRIAQMRQRKRF